MKFGDHHAYFIEGEREAVLAEVEKFLEKEIGMELKGNPDYQILDYGNFSIDDARALKEMHSGRAVGEKRFFVVSFSSATNEAQNSLLKIFEEPNPTSRFFIIAPSAGILLPTLRSRFEIIKTEQKNKNSLDISPEDFLKALPGKRMKDIKKITDGLSKEEISKEDIRIFLENLADTLRERIISKKEDPKKLSEVLMVLSYIGDRSTSLKMLLEHLALVLS